MFITTQDDKAYNTNSIIKMWVEEKEPEVFELRAKTDGIELRSIVIATYNKKSSAIQRLYDLARELD